MEDQRRHRAEDEGQQHRQHGVIERADERADEALVADQISVIAEAHEGAGLGQLPVVAAHEEGEEPGKDDDGEAMMVIAGT